MLKRRIKRITIKNYRSITDLTVELEDLTVLVGANGSGKSNFVDVLRFLGEAIQNLENAVNRRGGMGYIRRKSSKGKPYDVLIEIEVNIDDVNYVYGFILGSDKVNEYKIKQEYLTENNMPLFAYTQKKGWQQRADNTFSSLPERNLALSTFSDLAGIKPIYQFLLEISFCTIFPDAIRKPQEPRNPIPLEEHGENFASALREFARDNQYKNYKNEIVQYLSMIVEDIEDFRVVPVSRYLVIKLKHQDLEFDLQQESDGTVRALGILLALHQLPTPSLLAIEEPELMIHPRALAYVCSAISMSSVRQQIIITTHSLDLIQMFDEENPNFLRIVEKTHEGTKIDILDPYQRDIINEQIFKTSDLIRVEGLRRAEAE